MLGDKSLLLRVSKCAKKAHKERIPGTREEGETKSMEGMEFKNVRRLGTRGTLWGLRT
jgi:hypothetical protein